MQDRPTKKFIINCDAERYEYYEEWINSHKCTKHKPFITISFTIMSHGPYVQARCHCGQYVDISPHTEETEA